MLPLLPDDLGNRIDAKGRRVVKLARHSLRKSLELVRKHLSDLQDASPDPVELVHQLRVASRRADIALRVFKTGLPCHRQNWFRQTLKQIRDDAGRVRDLDLLEMKWRTSSGELALRTTSAAAEWMHGRIVQQRTEASRLSFRWTKARFLSRLKRRTDSLVRRTGFKGSRNARTAMGDSLSRFAERLTESATRMTTDPQSIHQVRINARHLRYALEVLQPILPDDCSSVCTTLSQMQDELGRLNDEATGVRYLAQAIDECPDSAIATALRVVLGTIENDASRKLSEWKTESGK